MTTVAQLQIELAANVARLTEDFGKAKEEVTSSLAVINREVSESMKGIGESIESVNEHIKGMQEAFQMVSEFAIGGAIGEKILDMGKEFAETAEQIKRTSQMTAMSTDQVQELGYAAMATGSSSEAMSTGMRKLTMTMTEAKDGSREALAAFHNVGISQEELKNSSPHDILMKVADAYSQSADNANKSANAQKLFGRSGLELIPMLNQGSQGLDELGARAHELGVVLDQETIEKGEEANEKFKEVGAVFKATALQVGSDLVPSMEKAAVAFVSSATEGGMMHTVMEGVNATISATVEVLSELVQMATSVGQTFLATCNAIGSAVLQVFGQDSAPMTGMELFKNMLAVIEVAFIALRVAVDGVCEYIKGRLSELGEYSKTIGKVINDALHGNWRSITADWNAGLAQVEKTVEQSMQRISNIAKQGGEDINNAVLSALPDAPKEQHKTEEGEGKEKKRSIGGDLGTGQHGAKSKMSEYEEKLVEAKVYYTKTNDLREFSLQQEMAYWKQILSTEQVSTQDRLSIQRKISTLELDEMKKTASQRQKLGLERIDASQKAALSDVAVDEQRAQELVKTGQITQEELAQLQEQYENRKYQIEVAAQQQRIQLMKGDPNSDPVAMQKLLDQLDQLTQRHTEKMAQLHAQAAKASTSAWTKAFQPIGQAFDTTVKGMIMGTTTWQKGVSNILQSVVAEFLNAGMKMVTEWAANEMTKTSATLSGVSIRSSAEQAANQQGLMSQAMSVIKAIMNDGAKTFSGVWSALSGIPYVGPVLAAAAAPAAMATVVGVTGQVASSAGGDWMIPTDRLNFLHKDETILPRDKSAGLDRMMEHFNGMQSAGQGPNKADMASAQQHIHVHANDSLSFHKQLSRDPKMLAKAAKKAMPYMGRGRSR